MLLRRSEPLGGCYEGYQLQTTPCGACGWTAPSSRPAGAASNSDRLRSRCCAGSCKRLIKKVVLVPCGPLSWSSFCRPRQEPSTKRHPVLSLAHATHTPVQCPESRYTSDSSRLYTWVAHPQSTHTGGGCLSPPSAAGSGGSAAAATTLRATQSARSTCSLNQKLTR